MEKNVKSELEQASTIYIEREGVQCGSDTNSDVRVGYVALTKRQEAKMEVAELNVLRFSLGVARLDNIGNENINGIAHVGWFGEKTREARH